MNRPKIDIVIVSYAYNEECENLTRNCIKSLYFSEPDAKEIFNVILVESEESMVDVWTRDYPGVNSYLAPKPYGYHKFLNFGRKKGDGEWVALCNNDLEFTEGWYTEILKEYQNNPGVLSFSPICPRTQPLYGINPNSGKYLGYDIRKQISGWCLVHRRELYLEIGDLDERFYHWFCDNDFAMTLKDKGILHMLVTSSIVIHHDKNIGKTTEEVVKSNEEMWRLTSGSQHIFQEKWKNKK